MLRKLIISSNLTGIVEGYNMKFCKTSIKKCKCSRQCYWEKQYLTRKQRETLTKQERSKLYAKRRSTTMKFCTKCHKQKPLSVFAEYRPGHYTSWCKQCTRKWNPHCYPPKNDGQLRVIFERQNENEKLHK